MANIPDNAGIITGGMLDRWNEMEALVVRDGDVAYAQSILGPAIIQVIASRATPAQTTAVTQRPSL